MTKQQAQNRLDKQVKMQKHKDRILYLILLCSLLMVVLLVSLVCRAYLGHREKPKPAERTVQIEIMYCRRPKNWLKTMEDLFDTEHKLYWKVINDDRAGYTRLFTRDIYIDRYLSELEETFSYAHELTHLKYFTTNETFTEYMAVITLYESGVPYFEYVARIYANGIINDGWNEDTVYDCGWYLQQYFENKKENKCYI